MAMFYHLCFYANIHTNVSFNTFSFSYKQGLNQKVQNVHFVDGHLG